MPLSTLSNIPPVVDPPGDPVLRGRIKTPMALIGAYSSYEWADYGSTTERTLAQQMRDGVPPYDVLKERAMGLSGRANINWMLLDQAAMEAEQPYNNILEGIDYLCTMPTNYGEEQDRFYYEQVMSEEFNRVMRNWNRFYPLWQQNVMTFVAEGVSFVWFEDSMDWRWDVRGMQYFKFAREIRADINEVDLLTAKYQILPHKLFEHCQDKEEAKKAGWNPDACWKAIKTQAGQHTPSGLDIQEWEKVWKNNDIIVGTTAFTVECYMGLCKELDGTVSQHLACAGVDEFLYKSEGKFDSMDGIVVPYLFGVGANGTFHSIRGIHQKAFAAASGINRMLNRALDMAIHSSTPWIKANSEDTLTELPLMPMGQFGVLKPDADFAEVKVPPFEQNIMPVFGILQDIFRTRTSQYGNQAQNSSGSRDRVTKFEKQMEYEKAGQLSTAGMNLFKAAWTKHLKNVLRRFLRKDYASSDPGGQEVIDFRARCMARRVPVEAIDMIDIDRVEVNMGIGKGSAIERRTAVDNLNATLYYRMDPEAQNICNNLTAAAITDARTARLLFPPTPNMRLPMDVEFANLENNQLAMLMPVQVLPNQNHLIHVRQHLQKMDEINQALSMGQMPMEQAIPALQFIMNHAAQHLQLCDQQNPEVATLRDQMEQFNQVITNGNRQLWAQQEKMAREAQHNNGVIGGEGQMAAGADGAPDMQDQSPRQQLATPNARILQQAAEAHQKMQDAHLLTMQKLRQREMEFSQKMALKDAEMAADIRRRQAGM